MGTSLPKWKGDLTPSGYTREMETGTYTRPHTNVQGSFIHIPKNPQGDGIPGTLAQHQKGPESCCTQLEGTQGAVPCGKPDPAHWLYHAVSAPLLT
jgi:hypothetical protein